MDSIKYQDLLEAGVHFGHLKKKWNPKMAPYIFMERKGIHIIDLHRTSEKLEVAAAAFKSIARSGKKILFVATKKQAKKIVEEAAQQVNMPFVTERWLGGMLTNFATIRKSIKRMQSIDRMINDGTFENITKKERLVLTRERDKLERVLGGIAMLNRLPAALYLVDLSHEHIAFAEAQNLNIATFAMVDTNSDPTSVDFPIPANDDASKSIMIVTHFLVNAIQEGLEERKKDKEATAAIEEKEKAEQEAQAEKNDGDEKEAAAVDKKENAIEGTKTGAKKTNKVSSKVEVKTDAKAETKEPAKEEVKTDTKAQTKEPPKEEVKTDTKAQTKEPPKEEVKTDSKVDTKGSSKEEDPKGNAKDSDVSVGEPKEEEAKEESK
ncbi:MAG: 30S ribosomal protein S2 [Bacteroidetes bacterium]|nr:30S ribosomal protein S2 [Bacteroidota bacterium]